MTVLGVKGFRGVHGAWLVMWFFLLAVNVLMEYRLLLFFSDEMSCVLCGLCVIAFTGLWV